MNGCRKYTLAEYSPLLICLGDPLKFRVVARISPSPRSILMAIGSLFEKATYSKKMGALLIKKESNIITIYASGIVTMTRLNSGDQGRQILLDIIDGINRDFVAGDDGAFRQDSGVIKQVDPMAICGPLPHTNCGKCGYKSCFYFATMVAFSEAGLEKCTPLLEERYACNRTAVAALISGSG
jgi:ArsR family metal-binding transcriptional regulator